ncbi:spore germination protein [Desulforamulus reducens MI-1]|uniref:Spore germination protein n=1 Tax=Desulforamulus reducens (strain ATCC BAA-1160 / DSM 100696 / MI-1) TaxID=349161 RepID=A4J0J8_DESRM|nr:endospore germination permease [Desulforamulus reducens]ABO48601.1 spore germination protein [Desulforamulus reducens MI-1]
MQNQYISPKQCFLLLVGFTIGTATILVPTSAAALAHQDSWMTPPLAAIPGLGLVAMLVALNRRFPGQSLVQYSSSILGIPGKLLGLLTIWFAFHLSSLVLRNIGSYIHVAVLFETPLWVTHLFIVTLGTFALRLGIETITRAFSILMLLNIPFYLIIITFSTKTAKLDNLLPVLSHGWAPVIHASLNQATFPMGEIVLFGMVIFHIKDIKNLNLYLSTGLLTTALAGVFALATPVIVLGADMVARTADAVLISVTNASGSNLIVPLLALSWFIFSVCKFLICYYAFVLSASHWARLSDYKPLIFPAGALIMVYSIIAYSNTIEEAEFAKRIWTVYAIPFEYGIPLVLLIAAVVRAKGKG